MPGFWSARGWCCADESASERKTDRTWEVRPECGVAGERWKEVKTVMRGRQAKECAARK